MVPAFVWFMMFVFFTVKVYIYFGIVLPILSMLILWNGWKNLLDFDVVNRRIVRFIFFGHSLFNWLFMYVAMTNEYLNQLLFKENSLMIKFAAIAVLYGFPTVLLYVSSRKTWQE